MKKNFLIIAAVAVAISASAFTNNHRFTSSQWVFTGSSTNDILDHTKYSQSAMEPAGCGTGITIPCKVELPSAVSNDTALENYLQSGVSQQDIIDQAITLKD